MADSVSLEIHDRCPVGLEIFQNQENFVINFTANGGVGDFDIVNSEKEVIALVQKHMSTISLLENTSRSEVLTVEISDMTHMPIACPPTEEEICALTNARVGLFQPNTLEIVSKGRYATSRAMDFRWEPCDTSSDKNSSNSSNPGGVRPDDGGENPAETHYNYRIVNNAERTVAKILLRRSSSYVKVHLLEEHHLTPVQIAVIFGGLSFLVIQIKKQRNLSRLSTLLVLLVLIIAIMVIISVVTS